MKTAAAYEGSTSRFVSTVVLLVAIASISAQNQKPEGEPRGSGPSPQVVVQDAPLSRDSRAPTSFAPIVKRIGPSVVNIFTTKTVRESPRTSPLFDDPFFRRFFGGGGESGQQPRSRQEQSLGSGVIVSEDGYILTNNHVVEGADEIRVALQNGNDYTAKVVGTDPPTELAVLKVEAKNLRPATLADSDKLQVGDILLAIGNPFGVGQTVTMGIVSATSRGGVGIVDYEDFIQTDASINPGNSGGALADAEGRVVGINTAILSRTGGSQGIGFAVPVNIARFVMDQIIKDGRVVRGYIGIYVQPLTRELARAFNVENRQGALVGGITPDSPAGAAGIKEGDIIIEFNKQKITDSRQFRLMAAQTPPKTKVPMRILRNGKERNITVTMGELPVEELAASGGPPSSQSSRETTVLDGVILGDLEPRVQRQLDVPSDVRGAVVMEIDPASKAAAAGLRPGDIIVEVNRKAIRGATDATAALRRAQGEILLRVWGQGGTRYVVVGQSTRG